jgi:hypothetical protein
MAGLCVSIYAIGEHLEGQFDASPLRRHGYDGGQILAVLVIVTCLVDGNHFSHLFSIK